jgi:hypothetical protein
MLKFTNTGWEASVKLSQQKMDYLRKQYPVSMRAGLERGGQIILDKARYYCPVETGRLRTHSFVTVEQLDDQSGRVAITFDMAYAVYVHEDVSATHASPTCAKFLERAVRETKDDVSWAFQTSFREAQFGTVPAFDRGTSLNPPPAAVRKATRRAVRWRGNRLVRGIEVPRTGGRTMRD